MTQQNDTITLQENGEIELGAAQQRHTWQPTVREILSWLPAGATPEQQDSAVQAHIKPSEIHWSQCPDTLHLPGHPVGHSYRDVNLPKYYRESFFTGHPYFHPDMFGGRLGTAGDPVPYSIAGDNIITVLLLACFIIATVSFTKSRGFMARQAKHFFRPPHGLLTTISETATELRFQLILVAQSCLLTALVYFFYVQLHVADTFIIDQYQVIAIFAGELLAYTAIKATAYTAVGWVFFTPPQNDLWLKSYLFITAVEGICLFPIVMLQPYFNTSVATTLTSAVAVIALFKLLAFYKTYSIFFRKNRAIVQNFLYFCTLELTPLAALLGILAMTCNYLKVNF